MLVTERKYKKIRKNMPGFVAVLNSNITISPSKEKECFVDSKRDDRYIIERRTNKKFFNDKLFFENEDFLFLLDGVILNNHILMDKYDCQDWVACVLKMHGHDSYTYYKEMRGSFLGCVYDKKKDRWLFHTDHIGDKQIFYAKLPDGGWLIGTEMSYMVDTMRMNSLPMTLDRNAAYMDITLGYLIEDNTLVKEIRKLTAGHYLIIEDGKLTENQYHRFSNVPIERTKDEMIEEIDRRFRHAVQLQFAKDDEYGYKHIAGLSGGLDSRMTVWVAHKLGYTKQLNFTFCQSNYIDFQVAQQIAIDLKHDFIFKALDGGNCIYDIDNVTQLTYGNACFFGLSHSKSLTDKINYESYGIVHTGMLGDVILGTYLTKPEYNVTPKISDGGCSTEVVSRLRDYNFKYDYVNSEIYIMYSRGFGSCGQGTLSYGHVQTETMSPFCDVDFMEYCFSIPLKWRYNHRIYIDWILSKYPQAADYIWEHIGEKILDYKERGFQIKQKHEVKRHKVNIGRWGIPLPTDPYFGEYLKGFLMRRLGLRKKVADRTIEDGTNERHTFMLSTENNMNPVDYWYYGNSDLRTFMDNYWQTNKYLIKDKQLMEDMAYLYEDCKATYDKLNVLTVLSAYKLIFKK